MSRGERQEATPTAGELRDGDNATAETAEQERPHIYVASLSDYNNGHLHGAWLDATDPVEGLQEAVDTMLTLSPTTRRTGEPAEEWRIDDYEGFGAVELNEFTDLATVAAIANGLQQHGEAFGAWVAASGAKTTEELSRFEDCYIGEFGSREAFGEEQLADMGFDLDDLPGLSDGLRPYVSIDVAGWARDMELAGVISTVEGQAGVFVFWVNDN